MGVDGRTELVEGGAQGHRLVERSERLVDVRRLEQLVLRRRLAAGLTSDLLIAHVRKANPPTARVPANTHPFRRDCCGRAWVFAHNGAVPGASAPLDGSRVLAATRTWIETAN